MGVDTSMLAFPKTQKLRVEAKRECPRCGGPIPEREYRQMQYCSRSCGAQVKADARRKPTLPCPICGKPPTWPSKTCSVKCGYEWRKSKARPAKTCPICHERFYPKLRSGGVWSKFCSRFCAQVKAAERLAMVSVTCAFCARTFRRTQGAVKRTKRTFCNKVCARKFLRGENAPNWRGGHDPNRGPKWLALAAKIRDRDEHVCTRCGRTEAENGQKLDVDHIQPWRALIQFGIDVANDPGNLTSLCRKCHRWKTGVVDKAWLERGDCLTMTRYQRQVKLPPLFARL